jgi:hypothetical protein
MAGARKFRLRPKGKRSNRTVRTPKVHFSSIILRAKPNPPPAQEAPWNSLVVQKKVFVPNNGAYSYATSTFVSDIISQLELATTQKIDVRVSAVFIWDLASRELEARLHNPTATIEAATVTQLCTDIKYPSRNGYTAIGFAYSKAIVATPILNNGAYLYTFNVGIPYGIVNTTTTALLLRSYVLWRPRQSNAPAYLSDSCLEQDMDLSPNDVILSGGNSCIRTIG